MNETKKRLIQFVEYEGISNRAFCKKISSAPNILTTKSAIGSDLLVKISNAYPLLNMDWVITGVGKMLKLYPNAPAEDSFLLLQEKEVNYLKQITELQSEVIKLKDELIKSKDNTTKNELTD